MANSVQGTDKPVVVLGKGLLTNLADLPKQTYRKFTNFLTKFQENPRSSGINLERVQNAADDKLYSARIDQKYRAVIAYDKVGDVYVVLYAGNHDDAYSWAVTKRLDVNQRTKAVQLYDVISPADQQTALQESTKPVQGTTSAEVRSELPSKFDSSRTGGALNSVLSNGSLPAHKPSHDQMPNTPQAAEQHDLLPDTYQALDEKDFLDFGVPQIYVPIMKTRRTWKDFKQWNEKLPEDAATCLQFVAEGISKDEVRKLIYDDAASSTYLGVRKTLFSETIAPKGETGEIGLRQALASYASQQSFVVVQGEEDLKRLLDAPLEKWRVFLHPSQRIFVERNYHGPFRLLGAAGTGKTVVAMHRAKRLASELVSRGSRQKVLFTTYSVTLATDVRSNLRLICTPEEFNAIDVINLDRLVSRLFKDRGYTTAIWYDGSPDTGKKLEDVWRQAIEAAGSQAIAHLGPSFFMDEWSQILVPQQISSVAQYLHVLRKGRGTKLSRAQKIGIWHVVEAYQRLMRDRNAFDIDMAMQNAVSLLSDSHETKRYAHIVVDEGQDFSAPAYRVIRALVDEHDNDIFIVGDAQQRIYGHKVVLSKCGITIQGRARKLRINYRTTEEIRRAADRIFLSSDLDVAKSVFAAVLGETSTQSTPTIFDDLNGEETESNDSRSLISGPIPEAKRCASTDEEKHVVAQWIFDRCGEWVDSAEDGESDASGIVDPRNICVVVRTNSLVQRWRDSLDNELPYGVYVLGRDEEDRQKPGVRIATMHRVKGLEFDYVIVADVTEGVCPPLSVMSRISSDPVAQNELVKQERSLIYVALTRARKQAFLVGCGV
ncbi:UvrD/REP helicase [Bifidobacterium pullorum subsp. saeculare DSM 6531 = LMG 14934]|uniref:DNA 3'-5' helicase n=1 Tax=Bifidobacterium pullorum subsp. saeculare DSM 6531 = LMG 14934 TaxID=1437611 RepID=A0A087CWZ6_9BIFI|nr:UvrD-helicase domain-containing protein [Bifidobacterium pullorum]KFI87796.1 UvrD/REP helicase [Bifidobacterium pullorum subsp. saeculare DSM 6531 = LMG 14934]